MNYVPCPLWIIPLGILKAAQLTCKMTELIYSATQANFSLSGHDLRPNLQIPTAISPPLSCHLYVSDWWLKAALWPSRSYRKSPAYPSPQWTKKAMRAPMSVINLSFINPVNPWQPAMNPSRCNLRMLLIRDVINPDLALFVLMLSLWRTLARFLALFWLHCRCK